MSPGGRRLLACAVFAGMVGTSGCGSGEREETAERTAAAEAAKAALQRFPAGRWQGRLAQRGLLPFGVSVTIRPPGAGGPSRVRYNGIDCSGRWTFLGRGGRQYRFRELIDRGAGGDCKGTGIVTLRYISRDRLRYEFRGGSVASSGFIRRRGSTPGAYPRADASNRRSPSSRGPRSRS